MRRVRLSVPPADSHGHAAAADRTSLRRLETCMAGETTDHRRRQPRRRPGAALHPLGCRGRELPDRLDAAHLRPADQRVEGRRRAVPHLLGLAAGGGERRRVAASAACASSCRAGSRQRSYETREGEKRTVFEIEVDEVGPSLKYATAKVTKTSRSGGGGRRLRSGGGSRAAARRRRRPVRRRRPRAAAAAAGAGRRPGRRPGAASRAAASGGGQPAQRPVGRSRRRLSDEPPF